MSAKHTAIYAGSFDPVTNGHFWMIREASRIFDHLIVAVGVNPDKQYHYPLKTRLRFLKKIAEKYANVEVTHFENQFLIHYAQERGVKYVIRGIRNQADFEYERGIRHAMADVDPGVTLLFLMPPRSLADLSSSFINGLVGPENWETLVRPYVPALVYDDFIQECRKRLAAKNRKGKKSSTHKMQS